MNKEEVYYQMEAASERTVRVPASQQKSGWKDNQYREALIDLMISIKNEISLEEKEIVLAILQLDSVEKIMEFNRWVKSKIVNGKLEVTPAEVMNQTSRIGRIKI